MKHFVTVLVLSQICFCLFAEGIEVASATDPRVSENKFFSNSKQLLMLSRKALSSGNYADAQTYAVEAVKSARLSDQYLNAVLSMSSAGEKIVAAHEGLSKADRENAARDYPKQFNAAREAYNQAVDAHNSKQWNDAIASADRALNFLSAIGPAKVEKVPVVAPVERVKPVVTVAAEKTVTPIASPKTVNEENKNVSLPSQYTVRKWDAFGDCFWNIAEKSWAYGDGHRWPILYSANKHKLPDPRNPNWIEPGMIMDIPSINGEVRQGMWDSGVPYLPMKK
ncbi:MAG: DUF4398 domain-containing protein [Termitinemataceae bacterium]|nr:MAG: DUF4398 domain-containing protein [Termitinemataceae bacterium]